MKGTKRIAVMLAAVALFVVGLAVASQGEENLSLKQVPKQVRATIQKHAQNGVIKEIERESEDGRIVYEVEVVRGGKKTEFSVAPNGAYLGAEAEDDDENEAEEAESKDMSLKALPAPVQKTVRRVVKDNPIVGVERENEDGALLYEVEYKVNGVERSVKCTKDGKVMELERKIDPKNLPAGALRALRGHYPAGVITSVDAVQLFFYEVEMVRNGKKAEVKVNAMGEIQGEEGFAKGEIEDDDDDEHGEHGDHDNDRDDDDDDERGEHEHEHEHEHGHQD